ncbi:hypothetical protein EDD28_2027 [Salana multivorans]|uniref:Integral membrane protein n=1 Tax=Salana multivorans TaxID=120377 RepID=A0A3N2DCA4_9MICO|nr:hypothetical protein [Salana multivorans]MBN8883254.1 hypothetical protein [Salana multivorans]OJX97827.1 MAG: hypothetical protein BGO96_12935 [Micrococcales bacterium 73-15]ROR97429.1 hypothetical protein EDD28_2027 [Salana multivorans]
MSTVVGVLVVLHLLGWAIALGGILVSMKEPKIAGGVLHGLYLALATGLLFAAFAGMASDTWYHPLDYAKIGVKLVIALVVVAMGIVGKNRPEKVTRGYLGAMAGLIVVNVAIAVLWR